MGEGDEDFLVIIREKLSWSYLATQTDYWCNRDRFNLQDQSQSYHQNEITILGTDCQRNLSRAVTFPWPHPTEEEMYLRDKYNLLYLDILNRTFRDINLFSW